MEHSDQMALGPESVSVKQRVCCCTLLSGRFTRFTRLSVCVNHASALELRTTLTVDRGAKAAADAGSNWIGIVIGRCDARRCDIMWDGVSTKIKEQKRGKEVSQADVFFACSPWGEETGRGRANEEGERARWEVEGEEASGGGWDLLRAYEGTIVGHSAWPHKRARISCTLPRLAALRI